MSPEPPAEPASFVTLAQVGRFRGNRGEVTVNELCDDPERFQNGAKYSLLYPNGERRDVELERAWRHNGRLILKFAGADTISDAELLRGCQVQIPGEELGEAPEGEFWIDRLIGCDLIDADSGERIGVVKDVVETGGPLLLEVDRDGREVLVPFANEICVEIAPERKLIRARLPEGLIELND